MHTLDTMTCIRRVAACIEGEYPLERAEIAWDNVGILIEIEDSTQEHNNRVLLCIDLTDSVLDECREKHIHSVVAYHPPIFTPIKRINRHTGIVYRCMNMRISVYTPHSALDGGKNGINAWLGSAVEGAEIVETIGSIQMHSNTATIHKILQQLCIHLCIAQTRYALSTHHTLQSIPETFAVGAGATGRIMKKLIEDRTDTENNKKDKSEKRSVPELLIVGEMSHHDILYANRMGVSVVILEHTRSERGFLSVIKNVIENSDANIEVVMSETDTDPVQFFTAISAENKNNDKE